MKNILKTGVKLKLFDKLEFWKSKFENWSFENYLEIRVLKIIWKLEFWKLNLNMWGWRIKGDDMWPLGGAPEGGHAFSCGSGPVVELKLFENRSFEN